MEIKVYPKKILYILMTMILIQPPYLGTIGWLDNFVFDFGQPIILMGLIICYIRNNKWSNVLTYINIFYFILLIPTIVNKGDLSNLIFDYIMVIGISMFINYGIKKYRFDFIKILSMVFSIYIYINFFSIIFFKNGLFNFESPEHSWFLGHKNTMVKYILPGLCLSFMVDIIKKNKIGYKSHLLYITSLLTVIMVNSSTSILVLVFIGIFVILPKISQRIGKIFNVYTAILLNVTFFIGIVMFRLQYIFSNIIENILGKSLHFTGRVSLWDNLLEYIYVKPLLGYGIENELIITNKIKYTNVSAHNFIVDYWYRGGILILLFFIVILLISQYKLNHYKNNIISLTIEKIIFAFSIVMLTETFVGVNMINVFLVIVITYNIEFILKNNNSKRFYAD